jgi:hypothetical protein
MLPLVRVSGKLKMGFVRSLLSAIFPPLIGAKRRRE